MEKKKRNLGVITDLHELKKEKGWPQTLKATSFLTFLLFTLPVSFVTKVVEFVFGSCSYFKKT